MVSTNVSSVFRPNLFSGKAAIVTGGATGIGCAITQELLYLGCKVMIASRKLDQLEESAAQMRAVLPKSSPAELHTMQCNIRKEEEVKSLISTTLSKFGKIDYLVNNAGGQFISPAKDIKAKGWHAVIDTNLTGTFYCCKEVYNQWMKDNGGSIVNIIADMFKGMPAMSHSGAARAGVDNLTKSLAVEWASSGVRINAVSPGSSVYSKTAAANYGNLDIFSHQLANIPAKRLCRPEEISGAVSYLLSPAAAFVSGITIKVDGAHVLYGPSIFFPIPDHDKFPTYSWDTDQSTEENPVSGDPEKPKSKL